MQPGRTLPLVLDPHHERSLTPLGSGCDRLGVTALEDPLLWRMAHAELATFRLCRRNDFEIGLGDEVADLQFALADDRQSRRFHPPDADDGARPTRQRD